MPHGFIYYEDQYFNYVRKNNRCLFL